MASDRGITDCYSELLSMFAKVRGTRTTSIITSLVAHGYCLYLCATTACGAEFLSLGNLGQWSGDFVINGPEVFSISHDGSVIAGITPGPLWTNKVGAFRWTRETGMVALSDWYGVPPMGMSGDGSTIHGEGQSPDKSRWDTLVWSADHGLTTAGDVRVFGFDRRTMTGDNVIYTLNRLEGQFVVRRWSWDTGFEPVYAGYISSLAVSADGSVIAGRAPGSVESQAVRWTENEGLTFLPAIGDYNEYRPQGVSSDGTVIAGLGRTSSFTIGGDLGPWGSWRWTDELGMVLLQEATPEMEFVEYGSLSADGAVFVVNTHPPGVPWNRERVNTVRWTEETGFEVLQPLPGFSGTGMTDVSLDGSRIVGTSIRDENEEFWLWTEETGMLSIRDIFEAQGLGSGFEGWQSLFALDPNAAGNRHIGPRLSGDGQAIAGTGINAQGEIEAWVAYLDPLGVSGDFNHSGELDIADIDSLTNAVRGQLHPATYDLNSDDLVDSRDREVWVQDLARTYFGDANLDGEFNSSDIVRVFLAGEYEDAIDGKSTWATGDWDGDGDFRAGDLIVAFQDGGYEQGPRKAIPSVPEPGALTPWLASIGLGIGCRRRRSPSR